MRIGILGLGSMGQMLVNGLCKSGIVQPQQLFVYNRTADKSERLRRAWPIVVCESAQDVCNRADLLFFCTKPLDLLPLLRELSILPQKHLVSIAAGVSLSDLETVHAGAISKVIPTITSQELRGVSLFVCNNRVTTEQRRALLLLLEAIGEAEEVTEETMETATILTSSAPGLIAGILEHFAQGAVRKTPELDLDAARRMLVETLLGTALLLKAENLRFDQLIERVATKGGITEEGLKVLGKVLPHSFDELFAMTEMKHARLHAKVQEQLATAKGASTT
jgi:pyrroline-5-carboxylate reductase